jgi:hypothetical protein
VTLRYVYSDARDDIVDYVVNCVVETVDYAMEHSPSLMPDTKAGFAAFVTDFIMRAQITTPTLLGALVYVERAKPHLYIALEKWASERVFLGAIILASKVSTYVIFFPWQCLTLLSVPR